MFICCYVLIFTDLTIASTIMGVGSVSRFSAVRWGVSMRIVSAWIFTLPTAAMIAHLVNPLFQLLR